MLWYVIAFTFSTMLELVAIGRLSDREKDLEILILRHQLDILERKRTKPIKPSKAEKLTLTVLANKLKRVKKCSANQLRDIIRIFQPETVCSNGIGSSCVVSGHKSKPTKAAVPKSTRK